MRISHKHKFIFLSKPKCASMSVREMLEPFSDILSSDTRPYHHHVKAFELLEHFKEMNWEWNSYFKFITIRNPWDMIVSYFNYFKPDVNGRYWFEGDKYTKNELLSFGEWVRKPRTHHYMMYKNGEFKKHVWTNNFSSLTTDSYVRGIHNEMLVDRIIPIENLTVELGEVFSKLNIPYYTPPVKNSAEHEHYRKYYDNETKRIIEEQFAMDIEIGKYKF